MFSRFTSLSFVIGLFFVLVSVILIAGYLLSSAMHVALNLYTGIGLFGFGVFMLGVPSRNDPQQHAE